MEPRPLDHLGLPDDVVALLTPKEQAHLATLDLTREEVLQLVEFVQKHRSQHGQSNQGVLVVGGSDTPARVGAGAAVLSMLGAMCGVLPLEMDFTPSMLPDLCRGPKTSRKRVPGPGRGTNRMRRLREGKNW